MSGASWSLQEAAVLEALDFDVPDHACDDPDCGLEALWRIRCRGRKCVAAATLCTVHTTVLLRALESVAGRGRYVCMCCGRQRPSWERLFVVTPIGGA